MSADISQRSPSLSPLRHSDTGADREARLMSSRSRSLQRRLSAGAGLLRSRAPDNLFLVTVQLSHPIDWLLTDG